jgi:hypothetical protein
MFNTVLCVLMLTLFYSHNYNLFNIFLADIQQKFELRKLKRNIKLCLAKFEYENASFPVEKIAPWTQM